MKYKVSFPDYKPRRFGEPVPPFSIEGVTLPWNEIHDDLVEPKLHDALWNYLLDQTWHQLWEPPKAQLQHYKPSDWDDSWINAAAVPTLSHQPRCLFGSDEHSVQKNHPLVYELWQIINEKLGGVWEIAGKPEGMYDTETLCPPTQDPTLEQGWRCYANATHHYFMCGHGHVHRDQKDLSDDSTATILWVANKEWYPSWGGEIMFMPEDPEGKTGDHQQFSQQNRGFRIGWADQGKLVSLVPNRLIAYDSRTMHKTMPSSHPYNVIASRRIAFRVRKKSKVL